MTDRVEVCVRGSEKRRPVNVWLIEKDTVITFGSLLYYQHPSTLSRGIWQIVVKVRPKKQNEWQAKKKLKKHVSWEF